ncbi:MAG: glycosyltransferase [Flavobacteriaceae bacterium]|nr:glycosyltransferase [Flavobacteriaceae bacterium]
MLLTALLYVFIAVIIIQICYYIIFAKLAFTKKKQLSKNNLEVSVIICARNEAQNLKSNLESILTQNHPFFEVIVVNDASTDNSLSILKSFKHKYERLKIIDIKKSAVYHGNKKNAITKGIETTTFDNLLFTDADCQPISKDWISEISAHFISEKQIVLGYGAYKKIKNSFLNKIIRFETLMAATQYFSYASIGLPYMGVGRNLAYKKSLFIEAKGLDKHKHILSGDDDLFVNQMANKDNTAICYTKPSMTLSQPKTTLNTWYQQKRRHLTTAGNYKPIHQFLLVLFFLSQFLFWFLAIILIAFSFNWQLIMVFIIIRLLTQYIILGNAAKKLNEKDLILLMPALDFTLVVVQFGIYISNLISKPKYW